MRKVNLGCGDHPLAFYTNVDICNAHADVVGDARTLNFSRIGHIRCHHMLEHVPFRDVPALLARMHGWMLPGGTLDMEVPDMAAIMGRGAADPWWQQYIYGSQDHDGEFHRSGFTQATLEAALEDAGWRDVSVRVFLSELPQRPGMPCLAAEAVA